MKIYLIRHGQSEGNVRNLWYGITDLPLTDLGRQQAAQVGEKLRDVPLAAAYISPLSRASETADIALRGRDEVRRVIVPDLREQNMGRLEPMSVADIRREMPEYLDALMHDWVHTPPVEGEPYDTGMAPRVARALDALDQRARLLFYRKYYSCQSPAQIARELGLTERAVEGRLYRIKARLRQRMGGERP